VTRKFTISILLSIFCFLIFAAPSFSQIYQDDMETTPKVYHESPLRRFEIIFTISIPFTAIHSYLAVRGVQMARQQKVSPSLSDGNWNSIGGLTILYSGFVGFWDWLHTRDKEISEKAIIPRRQDEFPDDKRNEGIMQYPSVYPDFRLTFISARF